MRDIAGEHVVIMQGKLGSDVTRVISLNETSLYLWNKLQGADFDAATVRDLLLENYEVAEDVAAADAEAWLRKLEECNLLTE